MQREYRANIKIFRISDLDALDLEDSLSSGILETSAELLEFDPEWIMDGDDVVIDEVSLSDGKSDIR